MDFFNDLQDYFSTLSSQEMLFFWLIAGLLFLIGLLIGLLLQSAKLKRFRGQYLITETERADFEARALAAEGKLGPLEKEVAILSREKVAVLDELEALKKRPSTSADPEAIRSMQDQLQLLQSENERLTNLLEDYQSSQVGDESSQPTGGTAPADVQDYLSAAEARFEAFEQRLQELSSENDRLNAEVDQIRDTGGSDRSVGVPYGTPHQPIIGDASAAVEDGDEPLVIRADITNAGVRTDDNGGMEVIVDSTPSIVVPVLPPDGITPDDLKMINNIGQFLEKKLNERGVYTYEQIASWTAADLKRVTKEIGYIKGIIAKDNWVGQAQALMGTKNRSIAPPATKKATTGQQKKAKLIKPTNLQVIEGIGPKIESILKDSGVKTLTDLAASSVDDLRKTLSDAGNRFKSHNPESWPKQAQLARDGKLEELKTLQDSM